MSIQYCLHYDRYWDSDFMDGCPSCPSGNSDQCLGEPLHFIQGFGRRCQYCKTPTGGRRWTVDEAEWLAAPDNCKQAEVTDAGREADVTATGRQLGPGRDQETALNHQEGEP